MLGPAEPLDSHHARATLVAPRVRHFNFQYRLYWKYRTEKSPRQYVSDRAFTVLQLMRRIGTKEPWTGCTETQLKRSWAYLARRQNVPFEAVAELGLRQALLNLQATFPKLEYIRVEMRQVGEWTTVIDPVRKLATVYTERAAQKRAKVVATIETMTRQQLDAWRWIPDPESDRFRRRIG
jgi:hypothetical protein